MVYTITYFVIINKMLKIILLVLISLSLVLADIQLPLGSELKRQLFDQWNIKYVPMDGDTMTTVKMNLYCNQQLIETAYTKGIFPTMYNPFDNTHACKLKVQSDTRKRTIHSMEQLILFTDELSDHGVSVYVTS